MRIGIDVRYLSHGLMGGVHTYLQNFLPPLIELAVQHRVYLYADTKRELELGTKHSVAEVLDFLVPDYESHVTYVRRHILKLEEALRNPPKHLKDARRIETRANLLAAGLAGCDDGYAFNTSVEKVRQARRRAASLAPIDSPREK